LQFGKHHSFSLLELLSNFIDVLSFHVCLRNPLSVQISCRLVVVLLRHIPGVLSPLFHLIKLPGVFLLVLDVLRPVVLNGLSNFVLLLFNLEPLLVVARHDRLLVAIDVRFYSHPMVIYPHSIIVLLIFHLLVILHLRMHFLSFDVVHF